MSPGRVVASMKGKSEPSELDATAKSRDSTRSNFGARFAISTLVSGFSSVEQAWDLFRVWLQMSLLSEVNGVGRA